MAQVRLKTPAIGSLGQRPSGPCRARNHDAPRWTASLEPLPAATKESSAQDVITAWLSAPSTYSRRRQLSMVSLHPPSGALLAQPRAGESAVATSNSTRVSLGGCPGSDGGFERSVEMRPNYQCRRCRTSPRSHLSGRSTPPELARPSPHSESTKPFDCTPRNDDGQE